MSLQQFLFTGDSLTQGTVYNFSTASGGKGSWVEQVTEALCRLTGQPLVGPGLRGLWLDFNGLGDGTWSHAGSWTKTTSSNAYDKGPYGFAYVGTTASANVTWTKPTTWRPIVGFCVYWIDYSGGGNWQYRVDGGTWTNMAQTIAHDNSLNKFYVDAAITSTVDLRGYDGLADTGICLVGIEPFFADPRSIDGIVVHNIGVNGEKLSGLCASTSGDRLAFIDSVKLGTGSPPSNEPNAGSIIMHVNDSLNANTSQWDTDLTTVYNRLSPLGPVAFVSPWECQILNNFNLTQEAAYRNQTKTTGAALGVPVYDHYDAWSAIGITGWIAMVANGLVVDGTHQTQLAHSVIYQRMFWLIRQQFLAGLPGPMRYPQVANSTAKVYISSSSDTVYKAQLPISIS